MSAKEYQETVCKPAREEFDAEERFIEEMKKRNKKIGDKIINKIPLEKNIQSDILDRLGLLKGGFFWRENSGMVEQEYGGKKRVWRAGIKGISDIMGVYKGRLVAIEVKRPGKKPSLFQVAFMQRVKECGGVAFVCDDDRLVIELLEKEMLI